MKENKHFLFTLIVPNENKRKNQRNAMHLMAALFLIFYAVQYISQIKEYWIYLLALLPVSFYIIYNAFFRRNYFSDLHVNRSFRILEAGFIFMGSMHFLQKNMSLGGGLYMAMSLFLLFLLYLESRILDDQFLVLEPEAIIVETPLRNKKIKWQTVEKIIVRENYITLCYTNSEFGQYEIINNYDYNQSDIDAQVTNWKRSAF